MRAPSRSPLEPPQTEPPQWQDRLITLLRHAMLTALALLLLWLLADLLLMIFAGILLGVLLRGLSDWVAAHTQLPAHGSLALVILGLILVITAIGYFIAPHIGRQFDQLAIELPQELHRIESSLAQTSWGKTFVNTLEPSVSDAGHAVVGPVFGVASTTIRGIATIIIVLFIGLYLAADPEIYLAGALRLVPPPRRPRTRSALIEITIALRRWLLGRFASMAIIAIMSMLGLYLLGIPLAFVLGLLSGILSFVPYVGSVSSALPAILIALASSTTLALYVILLFVAIHLVEGYVLVPLMQKRMVHLPPALTLGAQAILGTLFGIIGLVLATPLTAGAVVAIRMFYVEDLLHDEGSAAPREESDKAMP